MSRRLFTALPVAAHVRAAVQEMAAPLRTRDERVSWTRPDGWHVTLAFLGDVADADVDEVVEVCRAAVRSAAEGLGQPAVLRLSLGGPGSFGGHVAWLRVVDDPAGCVARMGASLQEALATAGLPVDRKPVRAHLTLARGRRRLPPGFVERLTPVEASWEVAAAAVVESILGRGPARYEEVASLPFNGL